jgi:hypothetical protein
MFPAPHAAGSCKESQFQELFMVQSELRGRSQPQRPGNPAPI